MVKMVFCEQCEDWYHIKCLGSSDRLPEVLNCKCGMVLIITESVTNNTTSVIIIVLHVTYTHVYDIIITYD